MSPTTSNAINLRRLLILRNLAVSGQIAAVLVAVYALGIPLPLAALGAVIGAQLIAGLFTAWRLRTASHIGEPELFVQLLFDVTAFTFMLFFAGGSTNPFVLFYLLPLAIAAAALPPRYVWSTVIFTVAAYTLLLFFYLPLPHGHGMHGSEFDLHVFGMWLGFVLAACLIAFFAVRMAATLRERDHELATLRENELKNERIVALGTLAAGTAHELGTPLSTVAVLTKELMREATEPVTREKLHTLRDQVRRCKEILSRLAVAAGTVRAEAGRPTSLDRYFEELLERWRTLRPRIPVAAAWHGAVPAPQIVGEETLNQAIASILNNAADASPAGIEVDGGWNERELFLEVRDRGPGFPDETQTRGDAPPSSTKAPNEGLGLGLFLAQATVQRLGGTVRLENRESGGARVRLSLPLASLLVTAA